MRDLFDCHRVLDSDELQRERLRIAFVAYGGMNRKDWRTVSVDDVDFDSTELARQLGPTFRARRSREQEALAEYGARLVKECRRALSIVLPFTDAERAFLDLLLDRGEIDALMLTSDTALQERTRPSRFSNGRPSTCDATRDYLDKPCPSRWEFQVAAAWPVPDKVSLFIKGEDLDLEDILTPPGDLPSCYCRCRLDDLLLQNRMLTVTPKSWLVASPLNLPPYAALKLMFSSSDIRSKPKARTALSLSIGAPSTANGEPASNARLMVGKTSPKACSQPAIASSVSKIPSLMGSDLSALRVCS